ncbi:hypothetical protein [Massilia timonae]|uniref:hypothetical protein n=1 Tax=Massilia timonae TaxID=47229 RepID=UPI0028D35A36|nr:hypothetical protein [Massilia timonae]
MTYEALRATYQCPERLARHLYDQLGEARAEIARFEAALSLAEAQRDKLKNKLAPVAPRRTHRGEN